MNVLTLVFSLILILSYGFFATWEKQTGSSRVRISTLGHQKATREILNELENEIYKNIASKPQSSDSSQTSAKPETKPKTKKEGKPKEKQAPKLNAECAKLNLWPLIDTGKEVNPLLYEMTAKLVRLFYKDLLADQKARYEYYLLDLLLEEATRLFAEDPAFAFEKITFPNPTSQMIYYKMLKGTKQWDLTADTGYPPLLDYIKCIESKETICLFHAHPDLIALFFGLKAALPIYTEIHKQKGPPITQQVIERICQENHIIAINPALFPLLQLGHPQHKAQRAIVKADEETSICLRKKGIAPQKSAKIDR